MWLLCCLCWRVPACAGTRQVHIPGLAGIRGHARRLASPCDTAHLSDGNSFSRESPCIRGPVVALLGKGPDPPAGRGSSHRSVAQQFVAEVLGSDSGLAKTRSMPHPMRSHPASTAPSATAATARAAYWQPHRARRPASNPARRNKSNRAGAQDNDGQRQVRGEPLSQRR
jgi:hypothetical protein